MKLIATHASTSSSATFDFTEPGGTIGRCPGNHLLLADDPDMGRVQAVIRIKDDQCSLLNVSSRLAVQLNGQPLPMLRETSIASGDTLTIGDYVLHAYAQPATTATAVEESLAATPGSAQDTSDIFKELLDGPGVLPVGQAAEASVIHPFELASQAPRNHPDPLQQLQADHSGSTFYEAAHGQLSTEPEPQDSHIFSNPTPTTLNLQNPLSSQRNNLINDALTHGHARDEHYENR